MRVHELGKEIGVDNKSIIEYLKKEGVVVKSQLSKVPDKMIDKVKAEFSKKKEEPGTNGVQAVAVPDFIVKKKEEETKEEESKEKGTDKEEKSDKQEKEVPAGKKKIVAVFNPEHSSTTEGRAAIENARAKRETEKKPAKKKTVKMVPARDRKPSDEIEEEAKKKAEEAQNIEAAAEKEEIKKEEAAVTEEKTEKDELKEDAKTSEKSEEKEETKEEKKTKTKEKDETKPAAEKKKQTKAIDKDKNAKTGKSGESEAVKSLRDKIVKGTVSITDIPIRSSKTKDKSNTKSKDFERKDQRNTGKDMQTAPVASDRRDGGRKGKHNKKDREHGDKFDRLENEKAAQKMIKQQPKEEVVEEEIKVITLPENITIKDFASKLKMQPSALIKKLFLKGQVFTVNDVIDFETAEEIALEFDVISEHEVVIDYIEELLKEEDDPEDTLKKRPPVVCVMGHVDHGKTSLLDAIRKTNVIQGEAGGITQHIGAYTVEINGESITFLDTPGHEAFTAMRLRGAQATDVAILVVAADDGVMPQTIEAINHAKAANIHVIVAINKIDKPGANTNKVMQELSDLGLVPEDWGGDTIFVPISAKTGEGIENLLEMVILGTEILELKANPDRMARGIVIEAKLDKGRGSVSTLLVQKGTLKVGDHIAMGEASGKVRAMTDDKGKRLKSAGPSTPVEITGISGVPNAGEVFVAYDNDKDAKHFAQVYVEENKKKLIAGTKAKMNLEDVFDQMKAGELKELDIVIKADVQGSAEAMKESLEKLSNDEVVVKVIHSGVGNVSESDAVLASASNAIIIAFNVNVNADARATIDKEKVDLRNYSVIYNAIDDVEAAMKGMLEPVYEEVVTGHVEVRQIFKASGVGKIAGSYVLDGHISRDSKIRLTRGEELIYEGQIASLKRFNDDAKEVKSGFECGIVLEEFSDIEEGDIMEAYEMKEVPRA